MMGALLLDNDQDSVIVACDDWNDPCNSDPIHDVFVAAERFLEQFGIVPNRLLVSLKVHHALLVHPLMLDRIWNCRELRTLSREDLAQIFDVEEYVVYGDKKKIPPRPVDGWPRPYVRSQ
jgi:hypothetical protein